MGMNIACAVQAATPITIKMQQLCAECLGLLGAVDPARVQACPVLCSVVLGILHESIHPQAPGLQPHGTCSAPSAGHIQSVTILCHISDCRLHITALMSDERQHCACRCSSERLCACCTRRTRCCWP